MARFLLLPRAVLTSALTTHRRNKVWHHSENTAVADGAALQHYAAAVQWDGWALCVCFGVCVFFNCLLKLYIHMACFITA